MGCDGGTIPTRDELVRTKKKPEQKDKKSELAFKWKHCAISQEPLRKPIVACELGCLYNKESILELLLDRSKFESARFEHIKGLRSVKELQLTDNPAYKPPTGKQDAYKDTLTAQYICPVAGLEMNGVYKFCYLLKCGCVFSERAMSEIKTDTCTKCGKPYSKDDVITLNGSDEEQEQLYIRMEQRRQQAKLSKKKKKAESPKESETEEPPTKKPAGEPEAGPSKTTLNGTTSQSEINGTTSHSEKSKHTSVGSKLKTGAKTVNGKTETKKPKTIQEDPSVSAAYKSLFTTSEKCKNQQKSHWVTHNPCYY